MSRDNKEFFRQMIERQDILLKGQNAILERQDAILKKVG